VALAAASLIAVSFEAAAASPARGAARSATCPPAVKPPPERLIVTPRWLPGVLITEYYPAPERWFDGRRVRVEGIGGSHRIDWLYSARGLAMQGEGIASDGRMYHFAGPYSLTWRNARGAPTYPCPGTLGAWTDGSPAWIGPTWLTAAGSLTYPLPGDAWSDGTPVRVERPSAPAQFASGSSLPLTYWRDVAVDPRLIARGSSVFVPAYCGTPSHGWFTAADTGGAIIGRHLDVFRAPPLVPWSSQVLRGQRVFVVPPGFARPASVRC
jgi:hypothetical protein